MMPGEVIIFSKILAMVASVPSKRLTGTIIAILFGTINLLGVRISAIVQLILTIVLFLGMAIFIFRGLGDIQCSNFSPFFEDYVPGIFMMVFIAMLAFKGFDILPQASEEVKSPIKTVKEVISSLAPKTTGEIRIVLNEPGPAIGKNLEIKVEYGEAVAENELAGIAEETRNTIRSK